MSLYVMIMRPFRFSLPLGRDLINCDYIQDGRK